MLGALLLATEILLVPGKYGSIGTIHQGICSVSYGAGTKLMPETEITTRPYSEHYGDYSIVISSGMQCTSCEIMSITLDGATGITTLECRGER